MQIVRYLLQGALMAIMVLVGFVIFYFFLPLGYETAVALVLLFWGALMGLLMLHD